MRSDMGFKYFVFKLFLGGYMGKFDFVFFCSMILWCWWWLVGEDMECCLCCVSCLFFYSRVDLCDSVVVLFLLLKVGLVFLINMFSEFWINVVSFINLCFFIFSIRIGW